MIDNQTNNDPQEHMTELTDILDKDIETIVDMRMIAERKVSRHQRMIERVTNSIGRPLALYFILLIVLFWTLISGFHKYLGLPIFDPPPYSWLQDTISLSALLMTTAVLITQNRQAKMTEQRRHLDLQITLLTERKVSKLIALVEDLRRDMPTVENRHDSEAQAMTEPVDPHSALTSLNKTLQTAAKEYQVEVD
ncbi:MAG: hypothetical protein NVS4B1_01130 [Ktedonobacteraceae bacterium]